MAVTPTTMTELNDLAKDYFSNVYQQLTNAEVPLKAQFARLENAVFTGKKWIFGVKTEIGGGAANAGANKSLPAAAEGSFDQGEATLVRTYTRMALDNFAIEVTKSQSGSFRPALAEVMSDRLQAHDLEVNRQLFCAGDGKLAFIDSVAGANLTLEYDYGSTTGGAGARHVFEGDQVAVYDSTGATKRGTATVTAVNRSTNVATVDAAPGGTVAGDFISKATSDTDNKIAGEAQGLLASVASSGTLHAIPGTGRWVSHVESNGGVARAMTDALLLKVLGVVRAKSRRVPNLAVCQPGVVLKYSEQFLPLRRIMGQDVELKGGYKPISGLQHAGGVIPVLEDLDCPDGRLFLINTEAFRMADLVGAEWFDGDGAQFTRVTDKDAIEGYIRKYWALTTIARHMNAVISDLDGYSDIAR
jgi:hypothetical protein